MSVRKIVALFVVISLLGTNSALAFPRDLNPSAIDNVLFPGDWHNDFGGFTAANRNLLRVHEFLRQDFVTPRPELGGLSPHDYFNIWNTPSFSPARVQQSAAAWDWLLNRADAYPAQNTGTVPPHVGRAMFTTHTEMVNFIERLPRQNLTVAYLGEIPRGFPFPFLVFSRATTDRSPEGLRRTGLPLVWNQALIHGGEASSGEAALALAYDLAHGRHNNILDRVNVIIVPRIAADGAKFPRRESSDLVALQWTAVPEPRDLNRDGLLFDLPVVRAMRKLFMAYGPHFATDMHERGAGAITAGITTRYGRTMDNDGGDVGSSGTTVLQVPRELTRIRYEYMEPDLARMAVAWGLTFGLYREGIDVTASPTGQHTHYVNNPGTNWAGPMFDANFTGGFVLNSAWDPDAPYMVIAHASYNTRSNRNILPMPGVVFALFENKSSPGNVGQRGIWERRVATGYICMLAAITSAADRGHYLTPRINAMRERWIEKGMTVSAGDMIPILTVPPRPTFWNQGSHYIRDAAGAYFLRNDPNFPPFAGRPDWMGFPVTDVTDALGNASLRDITGIIQYDGTRALQYVGAGLGIPGTRNGAYEWVPGTGSRDHQMFKFEQTWLGWNLRERIRPFAYIFEGPEAMNIATRMMLAGIEVHRLSEDVVIDVEGWHYNQIPWVDLRNSGAAGWRNRDVTVFPIQNRRFERGAFVVYLGQLLVNLIPKYMEPDLPWNVASSILLPSMSLALGGPAGGPHLLDAGLVGMEMPVYRFLQETKLPTYRIHHHLPLVNRGAVARFFYYPMQDEVRTVANAIGVEEDRVRVFTYDFQVHTRTGALVNGRFDIMLPTSEDTYGYFILRNDGAFEPLIPHASSLGWNIATVVVAEHGRPPFMVELDNSGQPLVDPTGVDSPVHHPLPATDDLIGIRIVEVLRYVASGDDGSYDDNRSSSRRGGCNAIGLTMLVWLVLIPMVMRRKD